MKDIQKTNIALAFRLQRTSALLILHIIFFTKLSLKIFEVKITRNMKNKSTTSSVNKQQSDQSLNSFFFQSKNNKVNLFSAHGQKRCKIRLHKQRKTKIKINIKNTNKNTSTRMIYQGAQNSTTMKSCFDTTSEKFEWSKVKTFSSSAAAGDTHKNTAKETNTTQPQTLASIPTTLYFNPTAVFS